MPKVAIVHCRDYSQDAVDEAIQHSINLLGGFSNFIKPGDKVLLKVNALMGSSPDNAVTTHPAIVAAMIKEVSRLGGKAFVGDSPGNSFCSIQKVFEECGLLEAIEQHGGEIANFHEAGKIEIPSPSGNERIRKLYLSKALAQADMIINLPKLKTHGFTLFTGAIKNLFGFVPGFHKAEHHFRAPHPADFAQSLVDILEIIHPSLHIIDAVWGMEGNGPSGGEPRYMGAIMASTDAVALDAVASAAIGYKPMEIETTRIAFKRGLGEARLEKLEILGATLAEITQSDWRHTGSPHRLLKYLPRFLARLVYPITRFVRVNPVIIQNRCLKCQICLNGCPAKTIYNLRGKIEIDSRKCIMCFCCHELCPYQAIELRRSWLTRMLGIGE